MKSVEKVIKSIIYPKEDFMVASDLINDVDYLILVYNKIFAEFAKYLEKSRIFSIQQSKFRKFTDEKKAKATFVVKAKDKDHRISLDFEKNKIYLKINGKDESESDIYGVSVNRDKKTIGNIKTDLASLKKKINSELSS
jgi:hypothetical protein